MKAVGIKQLKARLSEYVRQVRSGETILVTDREEVVAELRPPRHRERHTGEVEDVLDDLAQAGEISRASLSKRGWDGRIKGVGLPKGTAQALLDEIRAD